MRKLLCTAALAVFMLPFTGVFESAALAQKDKAKAAAGGHVTIKESEKTGKFHISFYNADDKFVGQGAISGYASEAEARKAIEDLKALLATAKINVVNASKDKPKDKPKKDKKKTEKTDK